MSEKKDTTMVVLELLTTTRPKTAPEKGIGIAQNAMFALAVGFFIAMVISSNSNSTLSYILYFSLFGSYIVLGIVKGGVQRRATREWKEKNAAAVSATTIEQAQSIIQRLSNDN